MEAEVTKKMQALKGLLQVEKQTEQSSKGRPAWPNGGAETSFVGTWCGVAMHPGLRGPVLVYLHRPTV